MPARVHALVVVRPEPGAPSDLHLRRALDALAAQTVAPTAVTIVLCGADAATALLARESGHADVVTRPAHTGIAAAAHDVAPNSGADAVWVLTQSAVPDPDALERLVAALETSEAVAIAAPKLVRWEDPRRMVSFGQTMTRFGRSVALATGEFDQGQHDGGEDAMSADLRGALVRADTWRSLRGPDPALTGVDDGLDLGVRARLGARRVVLVASARVALAGTEPAKELSAQMRRAHRERSDQLHRRLVYAPLLALPLHWLSVLPLALWRSIVQLVAKRPGLVLPEWSAAGVAFARVGATLRARRVLSAAKRTGWGPLATLRVGRRQIRQRLDISDAVGSDYERPELRFFSGGGAWLVLGLLVVSVVAFPALLSWPALGGGALAPLSQTVAGLWHDASYGARSLGWGATGPADPFSAVIALLGTLSPAAPSRALVVLWVLALPLAGLGGWFAATRVTERAGLRAAAALAWALSPAFLAALVDGRPTGVLVHLLLPWLLFSALVAHRAWTGAAVASLALAAIVACAPSTGPAFAVLWVAGALTVAIRWRGAGLARIVWIIVPTLVLFAPLIWLRLREGNPLALLADPGVPVAGTHQAGGSDALAIMLGFVPDASATTALAETIGPWFWLTTVPLAAAAVLAPLTRRYVAASVALSIAVLGAATALFVSGLSLMSVGEGVSPVWIGCALSLAWMGLLGAALITADGVPVPTWVRSLAAVVAVGALVVAASPALTSTFTGTNVLTNGPTTTLPAYVAAEGAYDASVGTLVLTPLADGSVSATVVWGGSETLGGQSTLTAARHALTDADIELAHVSVELTTGAATDVVRRAADQGIGFVLLRGAADTPAARATSAMAGSAMDQRQGLDRVGDTGRGVLWRISGEVTARETDRATSALASTLGGAQILVVLASLMLALPTRAERTRARRKPRVVGDTRGQVTA